MTWPRFRRPTLAAIVARWPALDGGDPAAQVAALVDLRRVHDARVRERDLRAVLPRLEALVAAGVPEVRCAALEAWATVLGRRAGRAHADVLCDLASEPDLPRPLLQSALRVALRFREDGELARKLLENAPISPTRVR